MYLSYMIKRVLNFFFREINFTKKMPFDCTIFFPPMKIEIIPSKAEEERNPYNPRDSKYKARYITTQWANMHKAKCEICAYWKAFGGQKWKTGTFSHFSIIFPTMLSISSLRERWSVYDYALRTWYRKSRKRGRGRKK